MSSTADIRWVKMPLVIDERGKLVEVDFQKLPFSPSRVFYISSVNPGVVRGGHAHLVGKQILFCVSGRISVEIVSNESRKDYLCLPNGEGLLVGEGVWAKQTYLDPESIMLVICSHPFDKSHYQTQIPQITNE